MSDISLGEIFMWPRGGTCVDDQPATKPYMVEAEVTHIKGSTIILSDLRENGIRWTTGLQWLLDHAEARISSEEAAELRKMADDANT